MPVTQSERFFFGRERGFGRTGSNRNLDSAYYRFSPRTLTMEVVAYRDIQPGEEITISCKLSQP